MIAVSIIYAIATIFLAAIDAVRIFFASKKGSANIDHHVSTLLAIGLGFGTYLYWHETHLAGFSDLEYFIAFLILGVAFIAIRLALYDVSLNIFRKRKIDYVSTKTNSWTDHYVRFEFWMKRLIGAAGWVTIWGLYKIIFKY